MGKTNRKANTDLALGPLIDVLGPISNRCRQSEGIDKVELLWDLGEALLSNIPQANDQLLRLINDRSYITRDLLRYALIVRRSWEKRETLREQFPKLSRYSLFREALPFLKGNRCGIGEADYRVIVQELNSGETQSVKGTLKQLKITKIGRTHTKGKALSRMAAQGEALSNAIKELFRAAEQDPESLFDLARKAGDDVFERMAQACIAIAEGSRLPDLSSSKLEPPPLEIIRVSLCELSSAKLEDRAGFRKAVHSVALMELADLLNAMRSRERLAQWQKRRHIGLSLSP